MAEISYRELLTVIARLVAATNAEAEAAEQRRVRIQAKASEAGAVGDRLADLEFDTLTRGDVATIAESFVGQARGAVAAATAARDLHTGAQAAADTVQRGHGGYHSAIKSMPVKPAKREAYERL
ncbi:hypothetical protein ABZ820_33685 [Streptomyces diacarni]|uniref:hypothetical protein n=1 Tax=Streptomyces diacarni TaxID=2800381 RepID=UPI0033F19BD1